MLLALGNLYRDKTIQKRYRAIVFGKVENDEGVIDIPVDSKVAKTIYKVVSRTVACDDILKEMCAGGGEGREEGEKIPSSPSIITTIDLWPVTGRTHQLRKHCLFIGHPIWGDRRYAPYRPNGDKISLGNNDHGENYNDHDEDDGEEGGVSSNNGDFQPHSKLCLWCLEVEFVHPVTGATTKVEIEEPEWYGLLRDYEVRLAGENNIGDSI